MNANLGGFPRWRRPGWRPRPLLASICVITVAAPTLAGGRVTLRDGTTFAGDVELVDSRVHIRSEGRVIHVSARQVLEPAADSPLVAHRFSLRQPIARDRQPIDDLSRIIRVSEFDDLGRRTITIAGPKGAESAIDQAITELYPTHVVLRGVNRAGASTLSLGHIPGDRLRAVLRRAVDPASLGDRVKLVEFLLQAGRFREAEEERVSLARDFPDKKDALESIARESARATAAKTFLLAERAMAVGQPARALTLARSMGKLNAGEEDARRGRDLVRRLEATEAELGATKAMLATRPIRDDPAELAVLDRAADEVLALLSSASLHRLGPMRTLAGAEGSAAEERWGLALSGWLLGDAIAQKDLGAALALWKTRDAIEEVVREPDDLAFGEKAKGFRGKSIRPDVAAALIEHCPAPATEAEPGRPYFVSFEGKSPGSARGPIKIRYAALLPPEYDRTRRYPTVITLRGSSGNLDRQLRGWGAPAAEAGAIVIAPEFRSDESAPYAYSVGEHHAMLAALADARKRFAIDPDRVLLSGSELGAFAAWDMGLSHPDQFAGLAPIGGVAMYHAALYWPNAKHLPIYSVEGSLNGGNPAALKAQFDRYFGGGFNAVQVTYPGRGREAFWSETPSILDWLEKKRRVAHPVEFSVVAARPCDRRFYFVEVDSFHAKAIIAPELFEQEKARPAKIQGRITDSNNVSVTTTGIESLSILLPMRGIQLDDPGLVVRVNRKVIHKGQVEPDLETMLTYLRRTGDRGMLVARRIEVARP